MTEEEKGRKLTLRREQPAAPPAPRLEERLHKVLAQAGLGSRRALEQRIADGLIKVNGEIAQVGMSVGSGDKIDLDGRQFVASALTEPPRLLMYNKPEGEVTTREDPEGRPTIFESLPALKGSRWIAIGRLDINTTGLLLLTTDGELANALMHPSKEVEREYVCRVRPPEGEEHVSDAIVERLARGVALEDGPAKFDEIEKIGGSDSHDWYRVVVKEGRNREVRRLWESQGCQVSRLKRVRYGGVELPRELLRSQSQELPTSRVDQLRRDLGLEEGTPSALTLQPVIGQRRAPKSTIHFSGERTQGYVGGQGTADEGRELRRFDNVREDRGRGRGGPRKHGGLTVSGEAAAHQANKPFKQRHDKGPRALPDGNPAAFRTWYVPDGVETGPAGHRNPDGRTRKPYGAKPAGRPGGRPGPAGASGRPGGGAGRPPSGPRPGGFNEDRSGERGPYGAGAGRKPGGPKPGGQRHPYGHPGNAPSFPSDHANPGAGGYDRPRGPRPGGGLSAGRPGGPGARPAGPGGGRPGGAPGAGRPGGRPGGAPGGRPAGGPGGRPGPGGPRGNRPPGGGRGGPRT
ncbi:MAG: pseudouridine synthase [Lysobacter sp.]|nr:MAG: pseudouridine synthase [Lysobacter sp.]